MLLELEHSLVDSQSSPLFCRLQLVVVVVLEGGERRGGSRYSMDSVGISESVTQRPPWSLLPFAMK
jgi:hypothetical protein